MAESQIEGTVCNIAEAHGWFVRKVQWIGRRGAPDRLFAKDGRQVWIEFKDAGAPLQPHQTRERKRMTDAGMEHHRCDSVRRALHLLGIDHR